jgi:DNA-binding FadR family transcriptional regulator
MVPPRRTKTSVLVAHALARRAAELNAGDSLPPERVLIEELQVGRSTLREALRLLELQGIVTIKAGPRGGPIVSRPDHRALSDTLSLTFQSAEVTFDEVVKARRSVEADLARLAAENATDADIEGLKESMERMADILGDEEDFLAENLEFHEICAAAAHNRPLELLHASLKRISDGHVIGVSYSPRHRTAILGAHRDITDAIAAHDPEAAYGAMTAHMDEFETYIRKRYASLLNRKIEWMLD